MMNEPLEPQPVPTPSTRWYFDKEQLTNTPSRKAGIDGDKELTYRQQSANYIQDMGQRLQVNQLCINTAIVYMHRFFMYHSFQQYPKNAISTASIFLAAKVEEQPRKLEYVIKIAHYCVHRDGVPAIDVKSEAYIAQSTELVSNENILLQTLGFDVSVDHPHTHVVKCCQLVRASKDLAQTSYFMATNSLHLTTMCLQYPPSVVACVCIHLACKWSNWEIPRSKEGKEWYYYVDGSVTPQQLESLTSEFLTIFNKSPSRLKKRILNLSNATSGGSGGGGSGAITNFPTHFTVDRNSSGAQTIKSRSRSPSPTASLTPKVSKPSHHLPTPPVKHKPNPMPAPLHFQNKPVPPPPAGYGGASKNPPPQISKPPYPHSGVGGPVRPFRDLSIASRQELPQVNPNGIPTQTSHTKTNYPSNHNALPIPHGRIGAQTHHSHGSQQVIGSQPPPHSHHLPSTLALPSTRQPFIKPQLHQPPLTDKSVEKKSEVHYNQGMEQIRHPDRVFRQPPPLTSKHTVISNQAAANGVNSSNGPPISYGVSLPTNSTQSSISTASQIASSQTHVKEEQISPLGREQTIGVNLSPVNRSPTTSSSAKKKKKKKEHKHKKDKEDKSHRHRDKEERKAKKEKHRDREDRQSDRPKKKIKTELGISQAQDNALKIKIVASKEALDSKSRASGRSIQSNQVVYY